MRLVAFGGDQRMDGAVRAARRSGWEAAWVRRAEDEAPPGPCNVALLPWPKSFDGGRLVAAPPGEATEKVRTLELIPPCRLLVHGAGAQAGDFEQAQRTFDPKEDEAFLLQNARLTAEGALAAAMRPGGRALLGGTCVVTGFGRIGRELTARLLAMGAFVIVCARSEGQMREAHAMGAHPVPLANLPAAAEQADALFNTVPAHVLDAQALSRIRPGAPLYELASPPYGEDVEEAVRQGVDLRMESGLPGRYAPESAGEALFEAALRALARGESEKGEDANA